MVGGRVVLEETGAEMLANADVGRLFLGQDPEASTDEPDSAAAPSADEEPAAATEAGVDVAGL